MVEVKRVGSFVVLPPPPDCCQTCAVKHSPDQPHNKQSLYYQFIFNAEHGRSATWKDAMEHCPDEVKKKWTAALIERGQKIDV